ncbi:MAG: hypothetical protein KJ566_01600 [Nanoarchaeota archaeon]|nr:hypothetical protein [Nanoarchaeota archaeon]
MLTKKQVREIKEHLEKAQNPLFFFDNDPDGLCSFLLLRRWIERGKGVAVKGSAFLTKEYFRKVRELEPDYIFILDKPRVEQEFFEKVKQLNLPIVWIDHHKPDQEIPKYVHYYNPICKSKKVKGKFVNFRDFAEPVTALCYQVTQRKEDLWIAVAGCISDKFLPDFYSEFLEKNFELGIKSKSAFEVLYESPIGTIGKILNFALMDRTSSVVRMLKYLVSAKSPYDVLNENSKNSFMHERYNELEKKCKLFVEKAKEIGGKSKKVLFFKYESEMSMSSEISNRVSYLFPKKIILIAKVKGPKVVLSVRGENVREILLMSIEDLEGSVGGGHPDAAGGQISVDDWNKFKENFEKFVNRKL